MLLIQVSGILFLFSLAATDKITFKPFIKSRYSLRERRAKSTTRAPLIISNETTLIDTVTEAASQTFSTQAPALKLDTTEKHLENANDQSTSLPVTTITVPVTTSLPSVSAVEKISTPSPKDPLVNLVNEVTDKIPVTDPTTTTTKRTDTTTQAEWVYDYYASDDENPRGGRSA